MSAIQFQWSVPFLCSTFKGFNGIENVNLGIRRARKEGTRIFRVGNSSGFGILHLVIFPVRSYEKADIQKPCMTWIEWDIDIS